MSNENGAYAPKLLRHPDIKPGELLTKLGESYSPPVIRAIIQENGEVTDMQLLSASGLQRLDSIIMASPTEWKYAPRPGCGAVSTNIVVDIHWLFGTGASAQTNQSTTITKTLDPSLVVRGQIVAVKAFVAKYDVSQLWTTAGALGFIGAGYQRLQVHFLSMKKDPNDPAVYLVVGKTLVRNRVREFKGKIVIETVVEFPAQDDGCERSVKGLTEGVITGRYLFKENPKQTSTGIFEGKLTTGFYTDKGRILHYDDLWACSDSYNNNQFVGIWKSYRSKIVEKCNWGDDRIPHSGDLDVGAGEFWPNDKYIKNGWQGLKAELETEWKTNKEVKEKEWWK
ncbi:MAG: hypothetical protein EPN47_05415 [Acidobacteria bacterium]|nr:MAG: hypothetical protein EPN47_05415 [Acidobacteriota bacterium]